MILPRQKTIYHSDDSKIKTILIDLYDYSDFEICGNTQKKQNATILLGTMRF